MNEQLKKTGYSIFFAINTYELKNYSFCSQAPGSGLGLSILKEICNRYGWATDYQFAEQQHIFTFQFIV